jgi:hypothetical protein
MQNTALKTKKQKTAMRKQRASRTEVSSGSCEGIPEFMIRFAREQRMKIFEGLAMPRYRHD